MLLDGREKFLNIPQYHTHKVDGQKTLSKIFGKVCVEICKALLLLSFTLVLMTIPLLSDTYQVKENVLTLTPNTFLP